MCVGGGVKMAGLCMSFVIIYQFMCVSFPFGFEGWMWDLIVLEPGHYFPFYFALPESISNHLTLLHSKYTHCTQKSQNYIQLWTF